MPVEVRQRRPRPQGKTEAENPGRLRRGWVGLHPVLPRADTLILLAGLLLTVAAKGLGLMRASEGFLPVALGDVALTDVALFLIVYALIGCGFLSGRGRVVQRLSIMVTLLIAGWSVMDSAWLFSVGTQLRLEVLGSLIHDAGYCWPIVWEHVTKKPMVALFGGLGAGALAVWAILKVIRPAELHLDRKRCKRRVVVAAALAVLAVGGQYLCEFRSDLGYTGMLLRPNSHLGAARSLLARGWGGQKTMVSGEKRLPRIGQRRVVVPGTDEARLPNIVIVMMESVAYWATSLGDPQRSTPVLAELASQGAEFTTTRATVTLTNKSIFGALAGVSAGVHPKKTEGVLVDPPYESLATILGRRGYRAGFFEMARAESFYPGMAANLGFELFWSRENLEDPSTHLSYAAGDDFLMLEPAFEWARKEPNPYLLFLMTSVAHDPYVAPAWFGPPAQTEVDRFLQCVEFTDAFVGKVRRMIERQGSPRETLLCVVSDHGEAFPFQHGLTGHLEVPFDETLRIVWLIHWPGKVPAGLRVDTPCSILDITPTLLTLLGFGIDQAGFEGQDALGPLDPDRRHFFAGLGNGAPRGFVQGSVKYVYTPQAQAVLRYDLAADPAETQPMTLNGTAASRVIETLWQWQAQRNMDFPADRFVSRVLYDHWRAWSSGQNSWAYYRPLRARP